MSPRLPPNSWVGMILLPQFPEQLESLTSATVLVGNQIIKQQLKEESLQRRLENSK